MNPTEPEIPPEPDDRQQTDEELMDLGKAGSAALWALQARNFEKSVEICERYHGNCGDAVKITTKAWDKVRNGVDLWVSETKSTFWTWFRTILKNCAIDEQRKKTEITSEKMPEFAMPPDFDPIPIAEAFVKVLLTREPEKLAMIRTRYWGDPGDDRYCILEMDERASFDELLSGKKMIPRRPLAIWMFDSFVEEQANTFKATAARHHVAISTVSAECAKYRRDVGTEFGDGRHP